MTDADPDIVHATAVAVGGHALLIVGKSGSGKSSLALEMMVRGAELVADDRVVLSASGGKLYAKAPETLRGLIEARGLGVLKTDFVETAEIIAVLDLNETETERIPPARQTTISGISLAMLHNVASQHFPAALIQYLMSVGRTQCDTAWNTDNA